MIFSCISSILLSFRLCFSSPTSSQTMSDHSPWGLVPWLEGQTALPLQAEGSAGSSGLWPTNHPDQEGAGRGEATGEASDLQFRCFFISFSDFPGSGCVWMIWYFRNVLVSLSPKIFKAVAAMQMKLPTLAMFHKSAQGMEPMMCSRGWYRKCLQGCKNCARLCILGHSYQLLCRMCLESARDAMIAGQLIGVRWAKVHDRSSKLCRSRLPSQVKFQRTVGRLLLLPCIDHPKISKTKIISMGL